MRRTHYRLRCNDCAWQGWAEDEFAAPAVADHEKATGHSAEMVEASRPRRRSVRIPAQKTSDGPDSLRSMFDLRQRP